MTHLYEKCHKETHYFYAKKDINKEQSLLKDIFTYIMIVGEG